MVYPTIAQVEAADREQICRWWRFLPSPAWNTKIVCDEKTIMDRIIVRYKEFGGFTPEISRKIGWHDG